MTVTNYIRALDVAIVTAIDFVIFVEALLLLECGYENYGQMKFSEAAERVWALSVHNLIVAILRLQQM